MIQPEILQRFVTGAMVGDAIGLPFEGLGRRRVRALLRGKPLRHRFLPGLGMVSDDTEHMLLTINAWRASQNDASRFPAALAWRLRLWMLGVPPACGKATAIACVKLLVGVPPRRSGMRSAGNGPAMRAGVIGLLAGSADELREAIDAASRVTHTDQRAIDGALAIALAARVGATHKGGERIEQFQQAIETQLAEGEMRAALDDAIKSVRANEPTESFANRSGCQRGVSGFIMHTVPVVVHLWLSAPTSYEAGVRQIIELGGDADTTAALLGGLLGIDHEPPDAWTRGIADFPVSREYARRVAAGERAGRARFAFMLLRNLVFFLIVLAHAARRLAPPYR